MTTVYLVRHGVVDPRFADVCFGQRLDPPAARQDLRGVARLLAALPANAPVITSPARRAQETAALLSRHFEVDSRWSERDFGAWEGRRWNECWAETPSAHLESVAAYLAFTPADAEAHTAVVERVGSALADIDDPGLVVVTHAGPIRAALRLAGLSDETAYAVELPNLSITSVARNGAESSWAPSLRAPTRI